MSLETNNNIANTIKSSILNSFGNQILSQLTYNQTQNILEQIKPKNTQTIELNFEKEFWKQLENQNFNSALEKDIIWFLEKLWVSYSLNWKKWIYKITFLSNQTRPKNLNNIAKRLISQADFELKEFIASSKNKTLQRNTIGSSFSIISFSSWLINQLDYKQIDIFETKIQKKLAINFPNYKIIKVLLKAENEEDNVKIFFEYI